MLNIHHLELFYYVARHGGISQAVRHMPYGIQQPTISSQMSLLEGGLGTCRGIVPAVRLRAPHDQLPGVVSVRPVDLTIGTSRLRLCGPSHREESSLLARTR